MDSHKVIEFNTDVYEPPNELKVRMAQEMIECIRITDYALAQKLINACWHETMEDNVTSYMPDIVNEYWIGLYVDNEVMGCYRLHQLNTATWQGHAFMLPNYRKGYSKEGCLATLRWLLDNTDCQKLIATVPVLFGNVMNFLERVGFKEEGNNRESYTKKGQLWDVIQYGLTRKEIEELV